MERTHIGLHGVKRVQARLGRTAHGAFWLDLIIDDRSLTLFSEGGSGYLVQLADAINSVDPKKEPTS